MLTKKHNKKRLKVLIGTSSFAALNQSPLEKLLHAGFEVINNPYKRKLTKEELLSLLIGVSGLIAGLEPLNREVLEKSSLKVISRCGAGIANVDMEVARKLGIKVFRTPHAPTNSVAELTIGGMLALIRHLNHMDQALHQGKWTKKIGYTMEGKTVAIIGFGLIGRRVAELLIPFRVKTIAVDPAYKGTVRGTPIVSLNEALSQADVISLHLSGEQMVLSKEQFKEIKKGSFIINCARGGVIDEGELCQALDKGDIAGAYLDCFCKEPYEGSLTQYSQVILTPHIGSYTRECRLRMESEAVENLIKGFSIKDS